MTAAEPTTAAASVAAAARALCRHGLIEAFGHVSARDGDLMRITPTTPLRNVGAEALIALPLDGAAERPADCPLEAPLHLAIYDARPDVAAICRTHPPHAVLWGALPEAPPALTHGLAGLAGEVSLHADPQLVAEEARARAAATALGPRESLLLAGNGAVSVGEDVEEAFVRAWFLEERCRVAWRLRGAQAGALTPVANGERARHHGGELLRAKRWAAETMTEADR